MAAGVKSLQLLSWRSRESRPAAGQSLQRNDFRLEASTRGPWEVPLPTMVPGEISRHVFGANIHILHAKRLGACFRVGGPSQRKHSVS